MNRFLWTRAALGLVLGSTLLGLAACDFDAAKEAFENAKIVLGSEEQRTVVGLRFVDATNGQLLASTFSVKLTGPDAATVVDTWGDPVASRNAINGLAAFAIPDAKIPTAAAPITIRLSATPAGYLPVDETVVLSDTGSVSVQVRALRPAAAAAGTQSASQSASAGSSGTTAPISAATSTTPPPSGGQAPPQASVSAPAGATFRNASNQAVTGTVSVNILSVDPTQAALDLLPSGGPGSGLGKNAAPTNVTVAAGNFSAYGNDGQPLSSLDAPSPGAMLAFTISSSFATNPAGGAWTVGGTVSAERYNPTSGAWEADGTFTLASNGSGGFRVTTTRLSLKTGWWRAVVPVTQVQDITLTVSSSACSVPYYEAILLQFGFIQTQGYTPPRKACRAFSRAPDGPDAGLRLSRSAVQSTGSVTFKDVPVATAGSRRITITLRGEALYGHDLGNERVDYARYLQSGHHGHRPARVPGREGPVLQSPALDFRRGERRRPEQLLRRRQCDGPDPRQWHHPQGQQVLRGHPVDQVRVERFRDRQVVRSLRCLRQQRLRPGNESRGRHNAGVLDGRERRLPVSTTPARTPLTARRPGLHTQAGAPSFAPPGVEQRLRPSVLPPRLFDAMRPARLLPLLLVLAACDSGEPANSCGTNGNTVTATVDGLAFTGTCIVASSTSGGFGFAADDHGEASTFLPYRQLTLDLPAVKGTYRFGGQTSALGYFSLVPPTGAPLAAAADSGSVVVEFIEGRRYKGRFSFHTSGPHTVGQGVFDVTLR